jgi:hypothetical protein
LIRAIGWKFYLVFIITGIAAMVVIYFFFPDTRGVPLEEVAAMFGVRCYPHLANELYCYNVEYFVLTDIGH